MYSHLHRGRFFTKGCQSGTLRFDMCVSVLCQCTKHYLLAYKLSKTIRMAT